MNFGQAIEALKSGAIAARAGWNGKNMFIYLNRGSVDGVVKGLTIGGVSTHLFDEGDDGTATRMPNLNMRAADGSTVTGWLASQTDMLAEDWHVLGQDKV